MPIADASGVIAFLLGEPAAPRVRELLRDPIDPLGIAAVNLAEVIDVLARRNPASLERLDQAIDLLLRGGLDVVPVDESIGRLAGLIRARHYDRRARPISLADCVAVATCRLHDEALVTSDRDLMTAARAEGVPVIEIADSKGRLP